MADRGCPLQPVPLPAEVRESLAELELELSEGEQPGRGAPPGSHPGPGTPAMLLTPGNPAPPLTRDPAPLFSPAPYPGPRGPRHASHTRDLRLAGRHGACLVPHTGPLGPPCPSRLLAIGVRTFGCRAG